MVLANIMTNEDVELIKDYREKTYRKPLKESSMKQFIANYNLLSKEFNEVDWIRNKDKVLDFIEKSDKTNSTKRNYLNCIIQWCEIDNVDPDLIRDYVDERDKRNGIYNQMMESGVVAENDILIDKNEFDEMLNKLDKLLKLKDIYKMNWDIINNDDKELYTFYVMMNLYKIHPLRNDYGSMEVKTLKQYEMLLPEQKTGKNFFIRHGHAMKMAIGDYKTNKDDTIANIPITDKKLAQVIRKYLKIKGNKGFLFDIKGQPINKNQLTKFLQRYNLKYLGKPVSTRALRKSFYTQKNAEGVDDVKQLAEIAKNNLHSVGTAINVYTKESSPDDSSPEVPLAQ
jgi:integrase